MTRARSSVVVVLAVVAAVAGGACEVNVTPGGAGPDAAPAGCDTDQECTTPTAPICDRSLDTCRACGTDAECAARDPGAPLCAPDGVCGACRDDGDCADPATPICDPGSRTCRACAADPECPSQVCQTTTGACAAAGDIIYVDDDAPCGNGAGTAASPACSISEGLALHAQTPRPFLHAAAGSYTFPVLSQATLPTFVGTGAQVGPLTLGGHCVERTASGNLSLRGFAFAGCNTAVRLTQNPGVAEISATITASKTGVDCASGQCVLRGLRTSGVGVGARCGAGALCKIVDLASDGDGVAILGQSGQLVIEGGAVHDAKLTGVDLGECEASVTGLVVDGAGASVTSGLTAGIACVQSFCELERVRVERAAGPGLYLQSSSYQVRSSVFRDNGVATVQLPYGGGVVITQPGATKVFQGNTVVGNTGPIGAPGGVACDGAATVVGSIVWGNQGAPVAAACAVTFSAVDAATPGDGNTTADPLLDPVDHYHLQAGSPCRDSGDPTMVMGLDIDGDQRAENGRADMGADELAP